MSTNTVSKIESLGLRKCTPLPTKNWHAFLTTWNRVVEENDMCGMLGRLHEGFTVETRGYFHRQPEYDPDDVLLFYLSIADGWRDHKLLEVKEQYTGSIPFGRDRYGNQQHKSPSELRQIVAKKAFDMLTQHFFKSEEESGRAYRTIMSEKLFRAMVGFFVIEDGPYTFSSLCIRNLTTYSPEKFHNQEVVERFVLHLAVMILRWREREVQSWLSDTARKEIETRDAATRKMLDEARPWAIEVLNIYRRLFEVKNDVNSTDLERIREIALREKLSPQLHLVSEKRQVETVEEAYVAGSHAAEFLVAYRVRQQETKRLKEILEADVSFQEAEHKRAEHEEAVRQAQADYESAQQRLNDLRSEKK